MASLTAPTILGRVRKEQAAPGLDGAWVQRFGLVRHVQELGPALPGGLAAAIVAGGGLDLSVASELLDSAEIGAGVCTGHFALLVGGVYLASSCTTIRFST